MGSKKNTTRQGRVAGMPERVKMVMAERGLSPENLAPHMRGWGPVKINKFLDGGMASLDYHASAFATALGVSKAWLLGATEDPTPRRRELGASWEDFYEWLTNPAYMGTDCPYTFSETSTAPHPSWIDAAAPLLEKLNPKQAQQLVFRAHIQVYGKPAFMRREKVVDINRGHRAQGLRGAA